jgi:hypothetical protein
VDENKLPDDGINVKCKKCENKFFIEKEIPPVANFLEDEEETNEVETKASKNLKKCPRCKVPQEGIDECQYCGFVFDDLNKKPDKPIKVHKKIDDKPKKTVTLGGVLGWVFGIFFVLAAIGAFLAGWAIQGLLYLIIAAILIPPIVNKLPFHLSRGLKAVIIIVCIFGGTFLSINTATKHKASNQSKPTTKTSKQPATIRTYNMGETVNIGYTSYRVNNAWWSDKLSDNQFIDKKADASWLFISLSVRNDDKKPRTIPPFKLIDSSGAQYQTSSKAWAVDGHIGALESLNPDVTKNGLIIFDVPQSRKYRLKISGGYWSKEDALIRIVASY